MINSQNILGAVFLIVLFIGAILLAIVDSFEPLAYINSPPKFLIVLSFAGFTYIKKDKYEFDELGSLTGASLSLTRFDRIHSLMAGFGARLITVLYGYVLGYMVDACWSNKV